ncbi:MAG: hypothetical protein CMO44_02845 [Verrucomicrobiales bacterium]|nr:hypothetical protein [Verrucomicrobiales bacterium]
MDVIHRHYLVGKDIEEKDLQELKEHQTFQTRTNERFLGSDFAIENLETLLQNIENGLIPKVPIVQIFLIGSNSFPMDIIKHSETFLRRYPLCKRFFDIANDGIESSDYSYHKVLNTVHIYVINIYKRHTDTLTICL